jgi:hypothetical protein
LFAFLFLNSTKPTINWNNMKNSTQMEKDKYKSLKYVKKE